MRKTVLLYFALLLWLVVPVRAQLTLSFPDVIAEAGETIQVDVTVDSFINIINLQGTFGWDPEVVRMNEEFVFNLDTINLFENIEQIENGRFLFLWFDLAGGTLEDGEALFSFEFELIGEFGAKSPLNIINDSTTTLPFLAGNSDGEINTDMINGMITVNDPVSTSGPVTTGKLTLYPNQPNPFTDETLIQFDLSERQNITFSIFDVHGKLISEYTQLYGQGSHFINLEQHQFPTPGTYLYQLKAGKDTLVKKLTFID